MGLYAAKNALVVAAQLGLGHPAARLFLHMALECWDDWDNPASAPPRRYFGSRESSAIALGFSAPDNATPRAFQAVKRCVSELLDKGAIKKISSGRSGRTAEFELQLESTRPATMRPRVNPVIEISSRRETEHRF